MVKATLEHSKEIISQKVEFKSTDVEYDVMWSKSGRLD
jgi:hypothetical protein